MKRLIILFLLFVSFSALSFSQIFVDREGNVYDQRTTENSKNQQKSKTAVNNSSKISNSFDPSKLEFGGNLGLQFGNYTLVNISPQIGYRFSNYFSAGAGIGYTYYDDGRGDYDHKEHFLSFNLYAHAYPLSFLIISVKPEISRMWLTQEGYGEKYTDERFVTSLVVGGGFRVGGMTAQIKYDVVQDKYSPYGNGIFYSIGYTF